MIISGLTGFAMAAYLKTDKATESSVKYFVYGTVTGAVMLYLITFWLGTTGSNLISALDRTKPFMAVVMLICLLSLVGIPPLAGFPGKFVLFGAAKDVDFTWLAIIAILNSAISLAVYLRIINPMFFQKQVVFSVDVSSVIRWVYWSCFVVTVLVGIVVGNLL